MKLEELLNPSSLKIEALLVKMEKQILKLKEEELKRHKAVKNNA